MTTGAPLPETRFAQTPKGRIAYQVTGSGPNLLVHTDAPAAVDVQWDFPPLARFLRRLMSFATLLRLDPLGFGASDRFDPAAMPAQEEWWQNLTAALDAAGLEKTAILTHGASAFPVLWYAATYPGRVTHLVIVNASCRWLETEGYPCKMDAARVLSGLAQWGTGAMLDLTAPSIAADAALQALYARLERAAASATMVTELARYFMDIDYRAVLPNIRVPTLVLASHGFKPFLDHTRYIARHIPNARYVELPGHDHHCFGEDAERIAEETRAFVTGVASAAPDSNRMLATVLFVDIVDSTRHVASVGDQRWSEILEEFYGAARAETERYQGVEVDHAGDAFFARFDMPTRAVRCARALQESVRALQLHLRAGVHAGECEVVGKKVCGLTVHIGSRIAAAAAPEEVLVSSTVKELVGGSDLRFTDRGVRALKGLDGEWRLYALAPPS